MGSVQNDNKLIIISGHLGSGKTEFSLNYTTSLRSKNPDSKVILCDLDFINPYFRSRLHKSILEKAGVNLITPENNEVAIADIPSVSGKIKTAVTDKNSNVILEVGGDDVGAIVLGHLNRDIMARGYEHYMVLNLFRPDTNDKDKIIQMIKMIERASRLKITHLIVNNHLMHETNASVVIDGYKDLNAMNFNEVPIKYVCINENFEKEFKKEVKLKENEECFILKRFLRYVHES